VLAFFEGWRPSDFAGMTCDTLDFWWRLRADAMEAVKNGRKSPKAQS